MIACKQCQTVNGLDHKFCKSCGAALADEAIKVAMEKHEQLVQEGYSLFNAGRTEEAFLIAQSAVEENSESANALTLLGMCFERTGQLAEALECFEKVVVLNPDSSLDRMKVTQLRNSLTNHMQTSTKSNFRIAVAAGLAMITICVIAGVVVVTMLNHGSVAANVTAQTSPSTSPAVDRPFDPQPTPAITAKNSDPQQSNTGTAAPTQASSQGDTQNAGFTPVPRYSVPKASDNDPSPLNEPLTLEPDIPKKAALDTSVLSNASNGQASQATTPESSQTASDPSGDPTPTPDDGSTAPPSASKSDPGVIQISVVHNQSVDNGGSSGSSLGSVLKMARDEYYQGHYRNAAMMYERALGIGGNEATINQRLGICYQRLGRISDAVSAYSKAVQAYQVAVNSGQGDTRRFKSALDSCNEAIQLLKG